MENISKRQKLDVSGEITVQFLIKVKDPNTEMLGGRQTYLPSRFIGRYGDDEASFIPFASNADAYQAKEKLDLFAHRNFVRAKGVVPQNTISEDHRAFLVVEMIQYTLNEYTYKDKKVWSAGCLSESYRRIVLNLIEAMMLMEKWGLAGEMTWDNIAINNQEAKIVRFLSSPDSSKTIKQAQSLTRTLQKILQTSGPLSLRDCFIADLKVASTMARMEKCLTHPFLMSLEKKHSYSALSFLQFSYKKPLGKSQKREFNVVFPVRSKWQTKVRNEDYYRDGFQHRSYDDSAYDRHRFWRNFIIHVNDDKFVMTKEQLVNDLERLFPNHLVEVHEFLFNRKLLVSHDNRIKGSILTSCTECINIAMLEANDIYTKPFLQAFNLIFSITEKFEMFRGMQSVSADINQNVMRLTDMYRTNMVDYYVLSKILKDDAPHASSDNSCAASVFWLRMTLDFAISYAKGFRARNDLISIGKAAYAATLKQYHGPRTIKMVDAIAFPNDKSEIIEKLMLDDAVVLEFIESAKKLIASIERQLYARHGDQYTANRLLQ